MWLKCIINKAGSEGMSCNLVYLLMSQNSIFVKVKSGTEGRNEVNLHCFLMPVLFHLPFNVVRIFSFPNGDGQDK